MKYGSALTSLKEFYYSQLTDNILPFWLSHARDNEAGGYHTCLNRDGSVYDYDKLCMWAAGRIVWTYAYMFNEFDRSSAYLDMAACGAEFLQRCGFRSDGWMYYSLSRTGTPLQGRRDIYTELSTVLGYTEYARALQDARWYEQAKQIFLQVWDSLQEPGKALQPLDGGEKKVRLHGHSMITLNVAQELRRFSNESIWDDMIDRCIELLLANHVKAREQAIFELVAWDGSQLSGSLGRWINPGHMIEAGIFFIHEGMHRNDPTLRRHGVSFIRWGFRWGWDEDFGGIFNDVDSQGLPFPNELAYTSSSKLWWQHAEALYGLLLAYAETGDSSFLRAYEDVHRYSFDRFADNVYGEWYAILDRRGNRVNDAKGTARKNSFHIARNFFHSYQLLSRLV